MTHKRTTNILEKTLPSLINVMVVFLLSSPVLFFSWDNEIKKICVILLFFLYNTVFVLLNKGRCLGMIMAKTYWERQYPYFQHMIFIVLYTASFASLFFWVSFPYDIFLCNMICIQLPSILITGTTFHGFVSGNMKTIIH